MWKGIKVALLMVAIFMLAGLLAGPRLLEAQGQNLLTNPGFEEGHYNQDGIAEITVPNGWRMHWSNRESNIFDGYAETARPETVVWNIAGAPASEKDLFWKDGIYTVKIFKGWAPLWAAMSQDVSGLEVGRRYRLVAPIYIDIVADYAEGKKIPPTDNRHGRVRLGASPVGTAWRDEANINYSGWWTADTINPFYLAYPTFVHEFTATATEMTVWIEVASNYPHPNNGFFIDTVGLYALDEVAAVVQNPAAPAVSGDQNQTSGGGQTAAQPAAPIPTATPRADGAVVHIVQSGDSYWSLAVQYAATMGITPEEALREIPALNNNPAVIAAGDELIIVPPSPERATAIAEASEQPAEGEAAPESEENATTSESDAETAAAEADEDETSQVSQALSQVTPSSICVQVFEDLDGDGTRADVGENPVPDQAVTVRNGEATVSTYITDDSGDLYCFENLEPATYQVQLLPSADYQVVGDDSWAVAMADGVMIPVSFGLQKAPDSVANASAADNAQAAADDAATTAPSNGPTSNVTYIVLAVAGVLALVAGAGVYLLRRG